MNRLALTIDGEGVLAGRAQTILEAARSQGIFIPTFCHLREQDDGHCRVCVVEVEEEPELVPACSTRVCSGMVVRTATPRVTLARRTAVELLLSDHLGDCVGPCTTACPAGIDIPGFIDLLARGEDREALRLIRRDLPLPGALGRICKRPCEDQCRRKLVDEPVAICHLKRFASDSAALSDEEQAAKAEPTGKRVAIVGAGPAGLSAAFHLARRGHACTVFDAGREAGGMLRHGLPAHRLPRAILDRDLAGIRALGVEFCPGRRLGADLCLDDLRRDHDAVFLALGAQRALKLRMPGEDARGCLSALAFLGGGEPEDLASKRVVVIGGGDVALDTARVARRRGARVFLRCLEADQEMPASAAEIEAAREEGIEIQVRCGVRRILTRDGAVAGVELVRCTSVFNECGEFAPCYDESEVMREECDLLIVAIGQGVDATGAGCLATARSGALACDPTTQVTSLAGVFAGGDCTTGPGNAVLAMAAGRRAADAIDAFVMGRRAVSAPYFHSMGNLDAVPRRAVEGVERRARTAMPSLAARARIETSDEVEIGFTPEMARAEAGRCLVCGCRDVHECKLREAASLLRADGGRLAGRRREFSREVLARDVLYDAHKCILCQSCVRVSETMAGKAMMQVIGRGFERRVQPLGVDLERLDPEVLRQMVAHCPVGALTRKSDPVQVGRGPGC